MTVHIVTDLSYGDAGKGTTVDYLARQNDKPTLVVRHNGGPQAAHNVITDAGIRHTFGQFGSATLTGNAVTYLSRNMLVDPQRMLNESTHLDSIGVRDSLSTMFIDQDTLIITPWHRAVNRAKERARGSARHGSCASGVNETRASEERLPGFNVKMSDLGVRFSSRLGDKLRWVRDNLSEDYNSLAHVGGCSDADTKMFVDDDFVESLVDIYLYLASRVSVVTSDILRNSLHRGDQVIFEGSQGVLLDEKYGFFPYVTRSNTTSQQAYELLAEVGHTGDVEHLGVIRAYTTRHGHGPFVTESTDLYDTLSEPHNGTNDWQGAFRVGHLDLVAHRYAIAATGGVDALVVTGMDRSDTWNFCNGYYSDRDSALFSKGADGLVSDLNVIDTDLATRAVFTEDLLNCMPHISRHPWTTDALSDVIEYSLGTKIAVKSYGPRAADKVDVRSSVDISV